MTTTTKTACGIPMAPAARDAHERACPECDRVVDALLARINSR